MDQQFETDKYDNIMLYLVILFSNNGGMDFLIRDEIMLFRTEEGARDAYDKVRKGMIKHFGEDGELATIRLYKIPIYEELKQFTPRPPKIPSFLEADKELLNQLKMQERRRDKKIGPQKDKAIGKILRSLLNK